MVPVVSLQQTVRGKIMSTKTMFYILKRILLALLTIWVVITITFFVMHAVPGGPFMSEKAISEAAQAALEAKYGLDKPLGVQYATYLKDILTKFDFGPSLKQRGRDVIVVIADGMKTSSWACALPSAPPSSALCSAPSQPCAATSSSTRSSW